MIFMKSGFLVEVSGLQTTDETKGFLPSAAFWGALVEYLHKQYTTGQGWRQQITTQLLSTKHLVFPVLWTKKQYCFMLKIKKIEKGEKQQPKDRELL